MTARAPSPIDPDGLEWSAAPRGLGGPALARPHVAGDRNGRRAPIHRGILAAVAVLVSIGIVMVYSTTAHLAPGSLLPPHLLRHLGGITLGGALAFVAFRLPLPRIRRLAIPFWGITVALLVVTLVAGTRVNGAQRWLTLPGLGGFQPAEFAKLATVLAVAAVLSRGAGRSAFEIRSLAVPTGLALLPAVLVLLQPDMGSAVVLLALTGCLILLAGAPLRLFVVPGLLGIAGLTAYVWAKPYAARRIVGFLRPWESEQNEGWQLVQSFVAFGRGGIFGKGLGAGSQKLYYLPEAHTDFILAMVAEELGLVGVVVVMGAFAVVLYAGVEIARRSRDRFAFFVASGATLLIALPACISGMVVTGLLPTKGIALPFLSYGRSNLLVCALAVALLLGIGCRQGAPEPTKVAGAERRGLLRT